LVNCYRKTVKNYHEHEYILFPHSSLIISLTQLVSVVEQNLPTLQEHLSSSQFYSGAEPVYPSRTSQMLLKGRQVLLHYKTEMNSDVLEG
jgi:hypothetical protein